MEFEALAQLVKGISQEDDSFYDNLDTFTQEVSTLDLASLVALEEMLSDEETAGLEYAALVYIQNRKAILFIPELASINFDNWIRLATKATRLFTRDWSAQVLAHQFYNHPLYEKLTPIQFALVNIVLATIPIVAQDQH